MRARNQRYVHRLMKAGFFACVTTFVVSPAFAGDSPRSYIAAPDVYQVIAENNKTRVILATWKPGHRDAWHSHPATAVYFLTDCEARVYSPDGKFVDANPKAGRAVLQAAIQSHSFENRSSAECRSIIFEQE
jgi:hypothetical protein